MALLTSADWSAVRSALDLLLTAEDLPDGVIALSQYAGEGMRQVLDAVPDAETRTGDELARLKDAAIALTASLLAPAVPLLTSETMLNRAYQYQRAARDWESLAALLRARGLAAIRSVTGTTATSAFPSRFAVARAGR